MMQVTRAMIKGNPPLQNLRVAIDERIRLQVSKEFEQSVNFYKEGKNVGTSFQTEEGPMFVSYDFAAYTQSGALQVDVSNIVLYDDEAEYLLTNHKL